MTSIPSIDNATSIYQYFKNDSEFEITVKLSEKWVSFIIRQFLKDEFKKKQNRRQEKKIDINIIEKGIGRITFNKKIEEKKEVFLEVLGDDANFQIKEKKIKFLMFSIIIIM